MRSFLTWLFDSSGFVPRRSCGNWTQGLVLLHNLSDGVIWLAYVTIPIVLVTFAWRRRDLPFPAIFLLFGAFIIGCGFTHFIDVMLFYVPVYRLSGVVKLLTAVVSMATVVALIPVIPRALALRSPQALQREIDERSKVEVQLRRSAQELQRSNRDLEDFALVASHDLQEPLRKILSFGDRLESRYGAILGDDGRDFLARMIGASNRMSRLIDDLLEYSRVTSAAKPFAPVDLGHVAADVVGDLESQIEQARATVSVGNLPVIRADVAQIHRLLINLVGNALKFRRDGVRPHIHVEGGLTEDRQTCVITVTDNGIGFDPALLGRLFNLFQRLHGRKEYEGTGMGLAICRKIAERHGGAITATSQPGHGSKFIVTLPTSPADDAAAPQMELLPGSIADDGHPG